MDFLYDDARLVIEVNGDWHHTGRLAVQRDQERTAHLVAAGYRVLPLAEQLVRTAPDRVLLLVREARRRAA